MEQGTAELRMASEIHETGLVVIVWGVARLPLQYPVVFEGVL